MGENTPWKINEFEPENDGLEDDFPDFNWVIFRFQPLIFRGVCLFGVRLFVAV